MHAKHIYSSYIDINIDVGDSISIQILLCVIVMTPFHSSNITSMGDKINMKTAACRKKVYFIFTSNAQDTSHSGTIKATGLGKQRRKK